MAEVSTADSYLLKVIGALGSQASYDLTASVVATSRFEESSFVFLGAWKNWSSSVHSGGVAKTATVAGARAEVAFSGPVLRLVAPVGPDRGIVSVSIDGAHVADVDLYSPTWKFQQVVFATTQLSDSVHSLVMEHTGTANAAVSGAGYVTLDAVEAAAVGSPT